MENRGVSGGGISSNQLPSEGNLQFRDQPESGNNAHVLRTHTPPPFGCISGARTPIDQTIRDPNLKIGLNERAGENLQSSN
jgi:hypothetical protein